MARRAAAGLPHTRVQAEIPDQMPGGREAADVADHRDQRRRRDDVDPGNRHQSSHVAVADDLLGDHAIDLSELAPEELQLPQPRFERQALIDGQKLCAHPRLPLAAERIGGRVGALEVPVQHRRDLILDLRPALDQAAAPGHQTAQHPTALIADPDLRDQAGREQVSQDPCVDLVGLHARVADRAHVLGVRKHNFGDMRLEDPRNRQRVAGGLHHDTVRRRETPREELKLLRRRRDPSRRSRPPAVGDRDLAEVAMHV
jgi:hypothetical protein